jgi:small subunit ribosomal protein S5
MAGLMDLRKPEEIAALRGLSVDQVLGLGGQEREASVSAQDTAGEDAAANEAVQETGAVA